MPADERATLTPEMAWARELGRRGVFVSRGTPLGDAVLAARDAALTAADRRAREDAARILETKGVASFSTAPHHRLIDDDDPDVVRRVYAAAIRASITTDEG